jgi:hypothetical protein
MKAIIIILCFLLVFSCESKKSMNAKDETKTAEPIISVIPEDVIDGYIERELTMQQYTGKKDLYTMYEPYSEEDKKNYSNIMNEIFRKNKQQYVDTMYELLTLGNRYTTCSFPDFETNYVSYTFIHNLEGFSDAIIIGSSIYLWDGGSFKWLGVGGMHFGDYFSFYQADDGLVVLERGMNNQFEIIKIFEIQYKYINDNLVLFNFENNKNKKFEMTEFIFQNNQMILNINDGNKCLFINENIDDLKMLYITVFENNILSIINYMVEYNFYESRGMEGRLSEIVGAWTLKLFTENEIAIFEECVFEYFDGKSEKYKESNNYIQIMELLEEIKN